MKRITVDEDIYNRVKELCSTNQHSQTDTLETLMDSYASSSTSSSNEALIARVSSLELELLELRNQLIS
ncbi:hypothetical protein LCGC14_0512210 [marine sediment metagenome]|uniref:Uncharacterized protein n=1 Tax=marine sediment metagenome TaxID=412755 RepID=A0A0F9S5S9_9ZZZZ